MSKTVQEARQNFKKHHYIAGHRMNFTAEQAEDRSKKIDDLEVRAVHCFSFWKDKKPITILPDARGYQDFTRVELRGQVASLNGPSRYPVMAGEYLVDGVEWVYGNITGIKSIFISKDQHFRDGKPVFMVQTKRYYYVLIQPDIFFEPNFEKLRTMYPQHEALKFEAVPFLSARPDWWKNLDFWFTYKRWGIADNLTLDEPVEGPPDCRGDVFRDDDDDDDDTDEGDPDYSPESDSFGSDSSSTIPDDEWVAELTDLQEETDPATHEQAVDLEGNAAADDPRPAKKRKTVIEQSDSSENPQHTVAFTQVPAELLPTLETNVRPSPPNTSTSPLPPFQDGSIIPTSALEGSVVAQLPASQTSAAVADLPVQPSCIAPTVSLPAMFAVTPTFENHMLPPPPPPPPTYSLDPAQGDTATLLSHSSAPSIISSQPPPSTTHAMNQGAGSSSMLPQTNVPDSVIDPNLEVPPIEEQLRTWTQGGDWSRDGNAMNFGQIRAQLGLGARAGDGYDPNDPSDLGFPSQ
ncbi:hypothetical protein FRC07_003133 [Ceratobasidium sp. 392]|nr:hypothetical protein FRC07_003133 [Ceratobasidium sp. 392]